MSESASSNSDDRAPTRRPVDYDRAMKLGGAIARYKAASRSERERADAAERRIQELTAENSSLKTRADSSLAARRVEELTTELRSLKHRSAFERIARERGVRPDGVEDLWQLSGYKAEADEIDEAAVGLLIDDQKTKRSYLFGESQPAGSGSDTEAGGTQPPIEMPRRPAPGSGQGSKAPGAIRVSDEQLSDPAFVMRNYATVVEASKARLARGG